jgi:hypothetical protein
MVQVVGPFEGNPARSGLQPTRSLQAGLRSSAYDPRAIDRSGRVNGAPTPLVGLIRVKEEAEQRATTFESGQKE